MPTHPERGQERAGGARPYKALSIMQPWAWLIVNGFKDVENRDWRCHFRGRVLVHAGKKVDREALADLCGGQHPVTGQRLDRWIFDALAKDSPLPVGGIVGEAVITGCVDRSDSPWFVGRHGILMREARPLDFIPCRGALGFFVPDLPTPPHPASDPGATDDHDLTTERR